MIRTELLELIRNGESSVVDFKRDDLEPHALAKTLVALANLRGGRVLLGVDDDGSIAGVRRAQLEEWVMSVARDKIRPEIIPSFELLRDVEPGKDVAVVSVEPGFAVHHVWHHNHRTYYIRVGTQSREASPEELARLFQQRGSFRLETRPVSGSSIADLDRRRLRDYFERVRQQNVPTDEAADAWKTLLVNTELLSDEGLDAPATVAGMLLFGNVPHRFLPHSGIDAVAYDGESKEYDAKERAAIRGPLVPLAGSSGLVDVGVVEAAIDFIKRHTRRETSLEDQIRREESWVYPIRVLREGVVNALVHRDYLLSSSDIELSIYADRLEIISPGRLPNGITAARMRVGCRAARNQLLRDVMRDYGYLEHMGMGIPRTIIRGMREHNGTEPDLIEGEEQFTLRLWAGAKGQSTS